MVYSLHSLPGNCPSRLKWRMSRLSSAMSRTKAPFSRSGASISRMSHRHLPFFGLDPRITSCFSADDEFVSYVSENWFPGSSLADLNTTLQLYPSDPADGSPFDTGDANAFTPEYKRIAAVQGDLAFNAPRRQFLDAFSANRTAYNFLSARGNFPGIGDAHTTDLLTAFGPGDMTDFFIRFVNDLNPNGDAGLQWPSYNTTARATLQFNDGAVPLNITMDNERLAGTNELASLSLRFPI
ncbi:hypothetical protein OH76DRAFT_1260852 [Lentinus brumalis]|uniref:Uncharacterized protein n=1 Tax=Lentinus brumalis TaxID=2498619 RepID=A0A371CR81_9APHY|nr:hypothetical protein OH76DRAFT_1260852 [Polyporus brumalis]